MGPSEIRRAVASRGHLNPGSPHVVFDRFELGLHDLVRSVWVVRWDVPRPLVQRVLNYPAVNVVTEAGPQVDGPHHTGLYGPTPKVSTRMLDGAGWAVGLLFRPAATPLLTDLAEDDLLGADVAFSDSPADAVAAHMSDDGDREALARLLTGWLAPLADRVDDAGRLASRASDLAENDPEILTAAALAAAIPASTRTVERVVRRHTGFTPKQLIECRRMQTAATRLYLEPETDLAGLAAHLGFADHAHLTRRYRAVIGETPSATREAGRAAQGR